MNYPKTNNLHHVDLNGPQDSVRWLREFLTSSKPPTEGGGFFSFLRPGPDLKHPQYLLCALVQELLELVDRDQFDSRFWKLLEDAAGIEAAQKASTDYLVLGALFPLLAEQIEGDLERRAWLTELYFSVGAVYDVYYEYLKRTSPEVMHLESASYVGPRRGLDFLCPSCGTYQQWAYQRGVCYDCYDG